MRNNKKVFISLSEEKRKKKNSKSTCLANKNRIFYESINTMSMEYVYFPLCTSIQSTINDT